LKRVVGQAPLDEALPNEETTRVTIVSYIDENGMQDELEVPGWVGASQHYLLRMRICLVAARQL
jgi:hypothetical protein